MDNKKEVIIGNGKVKRTEFQKAQDLDGSCEYRCDRLEESSEKHSHAWGECQFGAIGERCFTAVQGVKESNVRCVFGKRDLDAFCFFGGVKHGCEEALWSFPIADGNSFVSSCRAVRAVFPVWEELRILQTEGIQPAKGAFGHIRINEAWEEHAIVEVSQTNCMRRDLRRGDFVWLAVLREEHSVGSNADCVFVAELIQRQKIQIVCVNHAECTVLFAHERDVSEAR